MQKLYLIPFLVVSIFFVATGVTELVPDEGIFGYVWTGVASLLVLVIIVQMFVGVRPRRVASDLEEPEEAEEAPPEEEEEDAEENVAIDEEISREVYQREKAAEAEAARRETEERLNQLRALRDLTFISEEEYQRKRREILEEQ